MLLEMERRDYAQITAPQLSTQQYSNKPQHLRCALASTTTAAAAPVFRGSSAKQLRVVSRQYSLAICALEDLIAAVAEGCAVDDQVPHAVLALALATMDQIEDDEEGIVAAVDYRFV